MAEEVKAEVAAGVVRRTIAYDIASATNPPLLHVAHPLTTSRPSASLSRCRTRGARVRVFSVVVFFLTLPLYVLYAHVYVYVRFLVRFTAASSPSS